MSTEYAKAINERDEARREAAEWKAAAEANLAEIKIDQDVLNRKIIELRELRAQLAEANQRAERAERGMSNAMLMQTHPNTLMFDGKNRSLEEMIRIANEQKEKLAALSAGVLPEGAVCFVPKLDKSGTMVERQVHHGEFCKMNGDYFAQWSGNLSTANHPIMVPWHPPKAEPAKADVWIVGFHRYADDHGWEMVGVYSTKELAFAPCTDARYFAAPMRIDFTSPKDETEWPGYVRPSDVWPENFEKRPAEPPKAESAKALLTEAEYSDLCASETKPPKAPAASEEPNWEAEFENWFFAFQHRLAIKLEDGISTRWATVDDIKSFIREHVLPSAPPAAEVGGGQPSPMVGRAMKIFHNTHSANFLKRLRVDRGAIVSSADCSTMEVAFAQKERRWYVDEDGMGYVMRMKPWREECERLIEARCNARDVSDSPSAPPAAEVGGEPNYPIPEPGTLASELGRIADYIESNDCTRSWASKFIYSIIDELPTAIANHVMRPASPSVPPVTAKGTGEQSRDEKAMAAIREHGLDLVRLEGGIFSARRWHATGPVVKNDYPFSEPADAVFDLVKKLEAQPTHKAPTHP